MGKKTRATKFTDYKGGKPWLRRKGESSYEIGAKEMKKIILIVCEGQSEELYFKSFPVVSCTVTAFGLGQTKENLVDATIALNKKGDYDEVWCVFDMDIHLGAKEIASFDNAIERAQKHKIDVAYSNDAFELWFCLHYEYFDQKNRRDFYFNYLSKKWNMNYANDGKKYDFCKSSYNLLSSTGDQNLAIARAKRLYEISKDLPFSQQNPVTLIYKLVEILNQNIRI